jgi:flagellar biosynthesis chaperone FliJ
MRPFRFRAAAALVMRRKLEDAARLQLAAADNARRSAEERAREAAGAVAEARAAAADASTAGAESWRLGWHQSWIARTRIEAEARRRAAAVSAEAATRATAAVQVAHQRRRALERLRDRAWHRYRLEAGRHELQAMNELATLRHHARPDDEDQ